jgi:hypothetical protein
MPWRIFYDTGASFGSDDGAWDDAPSEGVLVIAEKRGETVSLHMGHDFYQIDDDSIVTRDERTLLHAIGRIAMSTIKFGRYTSAKKMERAINRARAEWA